MPLSGFFVTVVIEALAKFNRDDGWAIASHVALSSLLALFPFLIFATSVAGYLELSDFSDTVTDWVFEYWPKAAGETLATEIRNILTVRRGDALTFGGLFALYFASNGVEAARTALNRAYRVRDMRPFWRTRLQSLLFVFIAIISLMVISFLLVLLPLGVRLAQKWTGEALPVPMMIEFWRLAIAILVLSAVLVASHVLLPAGARSVRSVIPGIAFTLFFWVAGSLAFGAYLERFADYASTYAGLAGAMASLVFLYMLAVIFILGGEINAAWITGSRKRIEFSGED